MWFNYYLITVKVVIPPDGNLYNFSVKKFAEFLRQMSIETGPIKACIKEKIDGKKFSRMSERDMERFGIMHPVVLHFRKSTMNRKKGKKEPNVFML